MHRRVPSGRHEYHIVVAAFGAATSERVSDAAVTGERSELGLAGIRKALEPMTIAQTITYGGYFDLPDHDIYTVKLAEMGARIDPPQGVAALLAEKCRTKPSIM